jgi:hypothetical protein
MPLPLASVVSEFAVSVSKSGSPALRDLSATLGILSDQVVRVTDITLSLSQAYQERLEERLSALDRLYAAVEQLRQQVLVFGARAMACPFDADRHTSDVIRQLVGDEAGGLSADQILRRLDAGLLNLDEQRDHCRREIAESSAVRDRLLDVRLSCRHIQAGLPQSGSAS